MLTVKTKINLIIATFLGLAQLPAGAQTSESKDLLLWYRQPAAKWTEALPIGNGRLGAMIFGGVEQERIQFNEETLWTGEPRDHNREGAAQYLPQIRQLLVDGKQKEAEALATQKFMGLMSGEGKRPEWVKEVRALKGLKGDPSQPEFDDRSWKEITVPTYEGWETTGLEGLDGALWFRTSFDVPAAWAGKALVLDLNRVRDHDFTYVNGKLVGTTEGTDPRKYIIPKEVIKPGRNTLAVQVLNYFDKGGIAGYKDTTRRIGVYPEGSSEEAKIALPQRWKYYIQNDEPPAVPRYQADYQPFGDLWLHFKDHQGAIDYRRELDLATAVSRTSYTVNGTNYVREYFASQPNQAIIVHLGASQKGRISFEAVLNSPHKQSVTRKADKQTLQLSVKVRNGALKGESFLQVVARGGQTRIAGDKLIVDGADDVTLLVTAGTNYKDYKDVSADPVLPNKKALNSVKGKAYSILKTAHIREYQHYFNTFSINLGRSANALLPTNERIDQFASTSDPSLAALYVQYGRYLLISSSRPGTKPANLQGIWNDLLTPPWGSKYTTNINAEMNYWPAEVLNLSPMHEPLFGMIQDLAEAGKRTAKVYYDAPGWVLHHNTDLWRGTAPINASNHGIWVTGGAWLSQHLWERFLFTRDTAFLLKRG
ncbi:MAG TPA: glycoside hydrolase N-terminal domain-containing protein, partial [Chitinophagaceae bacterium]